MAKKILATSLTVLVIGLAWAFALNQVYCGEGSQSTNIFEHSYKFTVQNGYYLTDHTLHVSFPPSVTDYYTGKSQTVYNTRNYEKFVTPSAVQSMAENIRNITSNSPYGDEEFANAVLMIVHQIPYVRSNAKYPVETLVDNQADCDGLSILAASLMKAGGLDTVLLLYDDINPSHMNIGVSLEQMPASHSWWTEPSGIEYHNKTYWVAECTSFADWTVGDRPTLLESTKPEIIPLTNCEKNSPAQVSSSLDDPMQSSSISIKLTAGFSDNTTRIVNASGSISPALTNQTVTLYVNQPGYTPKAYKTLTNEFGNYTLTWNITLSGTYNMKASWRGSPSHAGSDSDAITVFISPQSPTITELSYEIPGRQISLAPSPQQSPLYVALLNQGPKEFLKSNLTGKDIALSGDFGVLSDGNEITLNDTTITIPPHHITYRMPGSRRIITITVPEKERTIPGAELLESHFGFILQQNEKDNYTASVKTLNGDDLYQITLGLDESRAVFINASNIAAKETWYKAVATVSEENMAVEVHDMNGTRLDSISERKSNQDLSRFGVLMTYQTGQIIAFKNLKVEAITHSAPIVAKEVTQENGFKFLYPYARISFLVAGTVFAIVCLRQRRRRIRQSSNHLNEGIIVLLPETNLQRQELNKPTD